MRELEGTIVLSSISDEALVETPSIFPASAASVLQTDKDMIVGKVARLVLLLGCQSDFIYFYERRMGLRLLRGRAVSLAREHDVLDKITAVAGTLWSTARSKLREAGESKVLNSKFHGHAFDRFDAEVSRSDEGLAGLPAAPSKAQPLYVSVVSGHVWALSQGIKFALPAKIAAATSDFSDFFARASQLKKNLTWAWSQGAVMLTYNASSGPLTLLMSPLSASLLLLFNAVDTLTLAQIAAQLRVSADDASTALLALTLPERQILLRRPAGAGDPAASDIYGINTAFQSSSAVISVRDVIVKAEEAEEISDNLLNWRKTQMDAAIVRIVKGEKEGVPFDALVSQVRAHCAQQFSPQRADIAKRVAVLVQRRLVEEIGSNYAKASDDDDDSKAENALRHRVKYLPAPSGASTSAALVDHRDPLWPRLTAGLGVSGPAISKEEFLRRLVAGALDSRVDSGAVLRGNAFNETLRHLRLFVRVQLASLFGEVSSQHGGLPNVRDRLVSGNELAALGGLLPRSLRAKFKSAHHASLRDFCRWANGQISSGANQSTYHNMCTRLLGLLETERFAEIALALDGPDGQDAPSSGWGLFGMAPPKGKTKGKAGAAKSAFDSDDEAGSDAASEATAAPAPKGLFGGFGVPPTQGSLFGGGFGSAPAAPFGGGFGAAPEGLRLGAGGRLGPLAPTVAFGSAFGAPPATAGLFGSTAAFRPANPAPSAGSAFAFGSSAPAPSAFGAAIGSRPAFSVPFGKPPASTSDAATSLAAGSAPAPATAEATEASTVPDGDEDLMSDNKGMAAAAEVDDEDFSSVDDKLAKWIMGNLERAMLATVFAKLSNGGDAITPESVAAATARRSAPASADTKSTEGSTGARPALERTVSHQDAAVSQMVTSVIGRMAELTADAPDPQPASSVTVTPSKAVPKRELLRMTSVDVTARDLVCPQCETQRVSRCGRHMLGRASGR